MNTDANIGKFCKRAKAAVSLRWRRLKKRHNDALLDWHLAKRGEVESKLLADARARHEQGYKNIGEPLISVIILTYHRSKVLAERTLPSIFAQTYTNFEIVIVGDCCRDDTGERVSAIGDSRINFYNLPYRYKYPKDRSKMQLIQGFHAGNVALERAKGAWLAFMDDDDVILPDHLETLLSFAAAGNYELVFAKHSVEKKCGEWGEEPAEPLFPNGRRPFKGNAVPHRTVLYRSYLRIFRATVDGARYNLGGDHFLWLRMGRTGVRAGFLPKVVALKYLRAPYSSIE